MPSFAVRATVEFEASDQESASAHAREIADALSEALDYALCRLISVGSSRGNDSEAGRPSERAEFVVYVEAEDGSDARDLVRDGAQLAELRLRLGKAVETDDPRRPSGLALEALEAGGEMLLDEIDADLEDVRNGVQFEETMALCQALPPLFAHHYTPDFLARWRTSVALVAEKLRAYPDTYLATTAVELAAHAILAESDVVIDLRSETSSDETTEAREKIDEIRDLAFEDHDVLFLFNPAWDGIETSPIAETMGMANLHPSEWFEPFRADQPA